MNLPEGVWRLPGLSAFVGAIARDLDFGLAIVSRDSFCPDGLLEALCQLVRHQFPDIEQVQAGPGDAPAGVLATPFGAAPQLHALLAPVFDQHLVVVELGDIGGADLLAWQTFLVRLVNARTDSHSGLALLVLDAPEMLILPVGPPRLSWSEYLRKGDFVIWAEQHLPGSRTGVAGDLAVALAVELCSWRLDLVLACVRAGFDDIADPLGWLERSGLEPAQRPRRVAGTETPCALWLAANQRLPDLQQRIWRAHVSALFPWLEEQRIDIVSQYRSSLRVDDHLRSLGISDKDEIELGALSWQLQRKVDRPTSDRLRCLARMRNSLAHRKPAEPGDLRPVLDS